LLSGIVLSEDTVGVVGGRDAYPEMQRVLAPAVALFLLRQVLDTFRSSVLLGPLFSALLQPCMPAALAYVLPQCGVDVQPSVECPPDFVQNSIRRRFLEFLTSRKEAHVLLSSAVVHGCIHNRAAASRHQLEEAKVLPPGATQAAGEDKPAPLPHRQAQTSDCEVLMLLIQALNFHESWQFDTLRVFTRILLDIFLGSPSHASPEVWAALLGCVRSCVLATGQRVRDLLQDSISSDMCRDGILDVFAEEWESHKAPLPDVPSFCGSPRRLLPCLAWTPPRLGQTEGPEQPRDGSDEARRVVSAFLLLRRLLTLLEQHRPQAAGAEGKQPKQQPWAGPSDEQTPLRTGDQGAASISEGTSFIIGQAQKIVCGVASPNGKCTRYLLLHDHWLLLVQPDLGAPGWAVAKTVRPIWQVQSLADRSDPRTLQLGLRVLPGDKKSADGIAEAGRGLETMSLNFEDVKRAHEAVAHLQKQRRDVRAALLQKALTFMDACMAQLSSPEEVAADRSIDGGSEAERGGL